MEIPRFSFFFLLLGPSYSDMTEEKINSYERGEKVVIHSDDDCHGNPVPRSRAAGRRFLSLERKEEKLASSRQGRLTISAVVIALMNMKGTLNQDHENSRHNRLLRYASSKEVGYQGSKSRPAAGRV
jgi:hypothetical protein